MIIYIILLSLSGQVFVSCEDEKQCSDPNASAQDCSSSCQPTCAEPDNGDINCSQQCLESGCVCNSGYILREIGGECIKVEDCPIKRKCNDTNASPKDCPSSCQPTCAQPDTSGIKCTKDCLRSGCVCNAGFILNETGGECIKVEDCPDLKQCIDPNASPQDCPSNCQPTCDQPDTSGDSCIAGCLPSGCVCNPNYILNQTGGQCIKTEECPS